MNRMTCIICPIGCVMEVSVFENTVSVTGNMCRKGIGYAEVEIESPKRTLTTTIRATVNGKKITAPVRTESDIPKNLLFDAMREINGVSVDGPLPAGYAVINDLLGTGVAVVLTDAVGEHRTDHNRTSP